jgi:hypothetical protein
VSWYLKACLACGGDLLQDLADPTWATCVMCARSFKVALTVELPPQVLARRQGRGRTKRGRCLTREELPLVTT